MMKTQRQAKILEIIASYDIETQEQLLDAMEYTACTPSHVQAIRLRELSKEGTLVPYVMERILSEEKPNQKEKISLPYEEARRYLPKNIPYGQTGAYILRALEYYQHHMERQSSWEER